MGMDFGPWHNSEDSILCGPDAVCSMQANVSWNTRGLKSKDCLLYCQRSCLIRNKVTQSRTALLDMMSSISERCLAGQTIFHSSPICTSGAMFCLAPQCTLAVVCPGVWVNAGPWGLYLSCVPGLGFEAAVGSLLLMPWASLPALMIFVLRLGL